MESTEIVHHHEITDFTFQDGSTLPSVQLAYLDINPTAEKVAVIMTCFRGRLRDTLNFQQGALRNHRIVVVALFGNGESSSPSNTPDFPRSPRYQDLVRAQHDLLTYEAGLNIKTIDVMLGFSMGGQCTYHWILMHPEMIHSAVIICSSSRTSRHNYQFLEGPKAALENSIDYVDGQKQCSSIGKPIRGLRAFGKAYSAWLTSAEWFEQELYKNLGYASLQAWDDEVAGSNYYSWHPEDLLTKINIWQKGDITSIQGLEGSSLEEALSQIKCHVLLMPSQHDQYFRWEAAEKESKHIPHAKLKVIPSVWGHLAGLGINAADRDWMDKSVEAFLRSTN